MVKFLALLIALSSRANAAGILFGNTEQSKGYVINLTEEEEHQLDAILIKISGNTQTATEIKTDMYNRLNAAGKINSASVLEGNLNCHDCYSDPD